MHFQVQFNNHNKFQILFSNYFRMRIVRFSTPKPQPCHFQDQKISLSKLSQVIAHPIIQYNQQKPLSANKVPNKKQHQQSHIKWVPDPVVTDAILSEVKNLIDPVQTLVSPKKVPRRKIFGQKSNVSKQNVQLPTFSHMPSMKNVNEEQSQYYSMVVHSPKQGTNRQIGNSKISQQQYHSPFATNEENSRINSQPSNSRTQMSPTHNSSSFAQVSQNSIIRLQQKLAQHEQQLSTIKKYLKNTQQLQTLKESIHEYQEVQAIIQKEKDIQRKREVLMEMIHEAKQRENELVGKREEEADERIRQIEKERLSRLQRMQKQNQRLYQNLKHHSGDDEDQFDSNPHQDYNFHGPVAFPSKDWQSQRQIMMPQQSQGGFQRSSNTTDHFLKKRPYNTTGELQISPIMKQRMNEISLIGFSHHNRTESFSMEGNTFREIMSPLEFQGENQTW